MFHLSKLCSTCMDMFNGDSQPCHEDWMNTQGYKLHHTSPSQFRAAALQKCYICSRNWEKVPKSYRLKWEAETDKPWGGLDFMAYRFERNYLDTFNEDTELPALQIEWNDRYGSTLYHLVPTQDLEITGQDYHAVASFRTGSIFFGAFRLNHDSSTSSPKSLQLIKEWCLDCEENHSGCRTKSIGDVPTRLIEIGTTEWRLCYPAKEPCAEPVRFVALSYRWPKIPSICLVESTEPSFRTGQQISALPRLFQDAMKVSLFLGARYIWIDALCIIQDSLDDWSYESTKMSQVYLNSYCTIAAAASVNPDDSLFKERSAEDLLPCFAEINASQDDLPIVGTFAIFERDSWRREFEASVLLSRGWCHQERILAPRTVHFAATQLLWECDNLLQNETFRKDPYPRTPSTIRLPSMWDRGQNNSGILATRLAMEEWSMTIQSYSQCLLTKETDKLVAISGLATLFRKRTNDTYLAGMWRHDLLDYLVWAPVSDNNSIETLGDSLTATFQDACSTRPYIAPSWSWASHPNGVYFPPLVPTRFPLATILDAQVTTIDGRTFSRVTDGFLFIQGPFFTASKDEVSSLGQVFVSGNEIFPALYPRISWDRKDLATPKLVILLLLKVQIHSRYNDFESINGLVLQPRTESPDTYVRIGVFRGDCDWTKSQCERYDLEMRNTAPGPHNQRFGYGAFKIY